LRAARDAGFTLQEIGDMAGLTASGVKRALERSREQ
jgi:DNA-directed RNA polymerase specialized sigma24 family protein